MKMNELSPRSPTAASPLGVSSTVKTASVAPVPGPAPLALLGGWRLLAAAAVALPLLLRAALRLREATSGAVPGSSAQAVLVDNPTTDH